MKEMSVKAVIGKVLVAVVFSLFVSSCFDEIDVYKGKDKADEDNPALSPSFLTKKNIQISINYDVPQNYNVAFEVYTENPVKVDRMKNYVKDKTLIARVSGKTDANGQFTLPLEVAAATKDIYVYSPTVGVPMLLHAQIMGDKVELTSTQSASKPENEAEPTRAQSNLTTSDNCCTDWKEFTYQYKTLGNCDANGKPVDMGERVTFSKKFSNALNSILPPMEDNDYVGNSDNNWSIIELSEESNVRLYFVKHNSERKNALAYYTFKGTEPTQEEINASLIVAYPNLHASSGLESGDCVALKFRDGDTFSNTFPANSKIGFALILDAYDNGNLSTPSHIVYSDRKYNTYNFQKTENHDNSIMANRPHMVTFKADGHFVLGFEDMPRGGTIKGQTGAVYHPADYSDDVFVLYSDPTTALPSVPDITPEPTPEPEPEFKVTTAGYYTFEDNWPKLGDYDMNDVIVKYTRTLRADANYNITGIDETYQFVNNGAQYNNAFGYEIKTVKRNLISELTINSSYQCANQGLDNDLSNATIMLFDNARKLSNGTTFDVRIRFLMPLSYAEYFVSIPNKPETSPFNPFIVVHKGDFMPKDRIEVHLPKCTPTGKANTTLFGTFDDISDPAQGLYYIRKGNKYPFALELTSNNSVDEFKAPAETMAVDVMYPKFNSWVKAGCGQTDADWYLHPIK